MRARRAEEARLERALARWAHRTRRTWRRGTWSGLAQDLSLWGLRALVLGGALLAFARGAAGAGEIAFVVSALGMLDGYLRQIGNQVRMLQKAVNDAEELVDLMAAAPERDIARPPARPLPPRAAALAFEHVRYGYEGAPSPLFVDLHVAIPAGQKVGLVGRSGSGKTTFVKLIGRLHEVSEGAITLGGVDIASVPLAELRRHVALVPQEPILFHRSLAENIAYARPRCHDGGGAPGRRAGGRGRVRRAAAGGLRHRGRRAGREALGRRAPARRHRARVPVGRAGAGDGRGHLVARLRGRGARGRGRRAAHGRGRTTLVIAHRLATVERMDRILVFDRGRIVEDGTPAALMAREGGLYRALRGRQALAA